MSDSISEMRLSQIATLLSPKASKAKSAFEEEAETQTQIEVVDTKNSSGMQRDTKNAILRLADFLKLKKKVKAHPAVHKYLAVKNPNRRGQLIDKFI